MTQAGPSPEQNKKQEQRETKEQKPRTKKGDTSNEIRMGTFLTGLDTSPLPA
jgi:hypothetical protein